jgi:hypothetical protein
MEVSTEHFDDYSDRIHFLVLVLLIVF